MQALCSMLAVVVLSVRLVAAAEPQTFTGKAVSVHDGDTLTVVEDGRQTKVRLHGIDAPEIGQPFGTRSRDQLATLTLGKVLRLPASMSRAKT